MSDTVAIRRFGVVPAEVLKATDGLALLRGMRDGLYPLPPIWQLFGFLPVEAEAGRVVFAGTPGLEHYNPLGVVHGGYAATLLDSAAACAVHSTLPAGTGYTTLELKVSFTRAMTVDSGQVTAEGRVLHGGRRAAFAESHLRDAAGRLLAHATSTCIVLPG